MTSRFYYTYVETIDSDVEFKASTFSSKAKADLFVIQEDGTVTVFRGSLGQKNLSVRPEDIILNGNYVGLFENGMNLTEALEKIEKLGLFVASTGVYQFAGITALNSSSINIGAAKGFIVKNTGTNISLVEVNYAGATGVTALNLSTASNTYFLLNENGQIIKQNNEPTLLQRRDLILLGRAAHPNGSIINVTNFVDFIQSPASQVRDIWTPIRLINDGIYPLPNNGNMSFNTSAGKLWGNGINFVNEPKEPNCITFVEKSPAIFNYRTQTGLGANNLTTITPNYYDNNGVITLITGLYKQSTNQRVFITQNGQIIVQYGQQIYQSFEEALAGMNQENFTIFPNLKENAILIGIITMMIDATSLSDTTKVKFTKVEKFGEAFTVAGGTTPTTLQKAYDNSTVPQILTSTEKPSGLEVKVGTGNNTNNAFAVKNGADTVTSKITGEGKAEFTQITVKGSSFLRAVEHGAPITHVPVFIADPSTSEQQLYMRTGPNFLSGIGGAKASDLTAHTGNTSNPHGVTAAQVGLGTDSSPLFAGISIGVGSPTWTIDDLTLGQLKFVKGGTIILPENTNTLNPKTIAFAEDVQSAITLTANRAVITDVNGKLAASPVTSAELEHLSGVTSPIQTQLSGKEPTITAGTTTQYWRGDKQWATLNKAAVGLGNVDNESKATMFTNPAFTGNATFANNVTISGDLTVQGTNTILNTQTVSTEDDIIQLRSSATVPMTSYAGLVATKYDGTNDGALVFDNTGTAKVGDVTINVDGTITNVSMQTIATRQDTPVDTGITFWDAATSKFITNNNIKFNTTQERLVTTNIGVTGAAFFNNLSSFNGDPSANVYLGSLGTVISRNIADSYPALIVNQKHASSTGDILKVQAAGTDRLTVKQDGKVGIGTTSPAVKLDINGGFKSIDTSSSLAFVMGELAATNRMRIYSTGPSIRFLNASDSYANLGLGSLSLGTYASTASGGNGNIITSGKVGIGTDTPTAQLGVKSSSTDRIPMIVDALTAQTANLQEWKVNGTTLAYLDKDGNFSAGTLNTGAGSPTWTIDDGASDTLSFKLAEVEKVRFVSGDGIYFENVKVGSGSVTDVSATSPLHSTGGTTPIISVASGYTIPQTADWNSLVGHTHTTTIAADSGTSQLSLQPNTKYKITAGGTSYIFTTPVDNNTLNTAGSTNTSSKIYLVGATSQSSSAQTYSDDEIYATNGTLTTKEVQVGGTAATMKYDATSKSVKFVFA